MAMRIFGTHIQNLTPENILKTILTNTNLQQQILKNSSENSPFQGLWIFGGKDIQVPVVLSMENLDQLKKKGKKYEYLLFPKLGHNTSSSESPEPVKAAVMWMKSFNQKKKK